MVVKQKERMMSESNVILDAYSAGADKLKAATIGGGYQEGAYDRPLSAGAPVQTIGEYDPTTSPFITTSASSLNVDRFGLKPGQRITHHGTTIMNPLRSSKEVEAVLGEAKYNPKQDAKSPEQMRIKQAELENQVTKLQSQMAILVATLQIQATNSTGGTSTPIPMIPVETPIEARTVSDLRNEAKERSLPYVGKNKKQLIEILKNAAPEA